LSFLTFEQIDEAAARLDEGTQQNPALVEENGRRIECDAGSGGAAVAGPVAAPAF
jgi:hypothetical protein